MDERSKTISRLCSDLDSRTSYIKAKLNVVVPSKIKALRLKSNMPRQSDLADAAKMHQSRISMFETPGAANFTLETLAKLAAVFEVGLVVDFVPFSGMLRWENGYSQDDFNVTRIGDDTEFLNPAVTLTTRAGSLENATQKYMNSPPVGIQFPLDLSQNVVSIDSLGKTFKQPASAGISQPPYEMRSLVSAGGIGQIRIGEVLSK